MPPAPQPARSRSDDPSRHNNPFATCWTRPGAIAFRFSRRRKCHGDCRANWRLRTGGPKSSAHTAAANRHFWRRCGRCWKKRADQFDIVDGYEQLGRLPGWRLRRRCRREGAGLTVTSHFFRAAHVDRLWHRTARWLPASWLSCRDGDAVNRRGDVAASHARRWQQRARNSVRFVRSARAAQPAGANGRLARCVTIASARRRQISRQFGRTDPVLSSNEQHPGATGRCSPSTCRLRR